MEANLASEGRTYQQAMRCAPYSVGMSNTTLPVITLTEAVVFPGMTAPLKLQRVRSVAAARQGQEAVVVTQRAGGPSDPEMADLYHIGVRGRLSGLTETQGQLRVVFEGHTRVRILFMRSLATHLEAEFEELPPLEDRGVEVEAVRRALLSELGIFLTEVRLPGIQLAELEESALPSQTYWLSVQLNLPWPEKQALLEYDNNQQGLELVRQHLTYERQVRQLQQNLLKSAGTEIGKQQRERVLRQELVTIHRELGEDPAEMDDLSPLRLKLAELKLPETTHQVAVRQLKQLEQMTPATSEYSVARAYLELLVDLPWSEHSEDQSEIARARQILDEDHYGLEVVKERILEYLAVMRLNPRSHAPILCFVGPPGTGKTSLGMSIARALGRKFERISLGGMRDEGELRGHRRTYVGAMSGRIIQAIRRSKVSNPLLMLDEVDKLSRSLEGDPAAALLEILDPAQNHEFHDNYLDVPFDLSKVFFIATANTLEGIPGPLRDRLEVIRVSGYSPEEKVEIALQHLVPHEWKEAGMEQNPPQLAAETLGYLVTHYTYEAGVRGLQRQIAKLIRRLALQLAEGVALPEVVDHSCVFRLLGREEMIQPVRRLQLDTGVSAGLAYTEGGGEVLYVEASCLPVGQPGELTGSLGEVMKESAQTARSYLIGHPASLPTPLAPVHIHVPAGAIPKDGPSAGLAMVFAMLSAYSGRPCRSDTASTGEISLCGLVLPVGGIKEKMLAAHRAGIHRVILPRDNAHSLEELPERVRQEMEFFLVDRVEDASAHAF